MRRVHRLLFLFLILPVQWAIAEEDPRSWHFYYDVLWLGNAEPDSAPSPIFGVAGAGYRLFLSRSIFFEPEIGFYGMEYFYRQGKALPAEIEYRDAVGTLGILLSSIFFYRFPLQNQDLFINLGMGPTFSFKIPLVPHGDAPMEQVGSYFLSNGRFFYIEGKGTLDWRITQAIGLTVRLRTLLPVFHIWDDEESPFYDQLFLGAGFALRLHL